MEDLAKTMRLEREGWAKAREEAVRLAAVEDDLELFMLEEHEVTGVLAVGINGKSGGMTLVTAWMELDFHGIPCVETRSIHVSDELSSRFVQLLNAYRKGE